MSPPQIGFIHIGHREFFHPHRPQRLNGLGQGGKIAPVDAHAGRHIKTPPGAQAHGPEGGFLGPGPAPHPVMPAAGAVITDDEFRLDPPALKGIQHRLVQQPAVGVELVDHHVMGEDAVHQLPEILADQGFAAGQVHPQHPAGGHLVDQVQSLLGGQFPQFSVRGIHVAVTAAEIAPPRHRPEDPFHKTVFVVLVILTFFQGLRRFAGLNIAFGFTLGQRLPEIRAQLCFGQIGDTVAEDQGLEHLPGENLGFVIGPDHQNPGCPFPAPQNVFGLESVIHAVPS